MNFSIQLAEEHHIPHIAAITNLEAKRSAATVSSSDEPIERWQNQYHQYRNFTPWLVALSQHSDSEEVIGYAKAAPYNARGGFMWSVSLSIYISEAYKGQRMGDALYTVLFDLLKRQGFINVYARIALPNPGSQRLHQRFGLKQTGVLPKFAWKFNTWHDMAIYTGMINETMNSNPTSLLSVEEAWQKRLNR
jgi:L-amino acid N-acyltransferase YncA